MTKDYTVTSNKNTDILIMSHMHNIYGGAEMALLETIRYLVDNKYQVHVIVGGTGSFTDEMNSIGVNYTLLGVPRWVKGVGDHSKFSYRSLNPTLNDLVGFVKLIDDLQPKVCLTNTIVSPFLAYAASIKSLPHIWYIHEIGGESMGLRYDIGESNTNQTIFSLSDKLIFNSKFTARHYQKFSNEPLDYDIIYPGHINIENLKRIKKNKKESNKFTIVLVGQIKPQKGQIDAVKAVVKLNQTHKNIHLRLIGLDEDPKYVRKIKKIINENRLETNVTLEGHMKEPSKFVAEADVALVCSVGEAFGRVTIEAMGMGVPVIGASSGGTIDLIKENVTGLFYSPGNSDDLANKIQYLIEHPSILHEMGKNAKEYSKNNFSKEKRFNAMKNILNSKNYSNSKKTNLSPLNALCSDYQDTVSLLRARENELKDIHNSKAYRLLKKIVEVKKRLF